MNKMKNIYGRSSQITQIKDKIMLLEEVLMKKKIILEEVKDIKDKAADLQLEIKDVVEKLLDKYPYKNIIRHYLSSHPQSPINRRENLFGDFSKKICVLDRNHEILDNQESRKEREVKTNANSEFLTECPKNLAQLESKWITLPNGTLFYKKNKLLKIYPRIFRKGNKYMVKYAGKYIGTYDTLQKAKSAGEVIIL